MKTAKAMLTFAQIGALVEGRTVLIRLPEQQVPAPELGEGITRTLAGIEVELSREAISRGMSVNYAVTSGNRMSADIRHHILYMKKGFCGIETTLESMFKGFRRVFGLSRSK